MKGELILQQFNFLFPDSAPRDHVSEQFIQGMLNRMGVGFHKYGHSRKCDKLNLIKTIELRLQTYRDTGNTEYLMDAANFCMIEFMYPQIPGAKFTATDSTGSPGLVDEHGEVVRQVPR